MSDSGLRELERRGRQGDLDARRAYRALRARLGVPALWQVEILDRRRRHVAEGRCRIMVDWRVNADWPWPLWGRAWLVLPTWETELGRCWTGVRCAADVLAPCCGTDQIRVEFRLDPD